MSITSIGVTISEDTLDVTSYVGSDWSGCTTSRNSTMECTTMVRGIAAHHYSRIQTTVAWSSGETEIDGLSSGAT